MRLVPAVLEIAWEIDEIKKEEHALEYNSLVLSDEDPLGAWLKRAKAKGETKNTDQVLLNLIVHLHRKIDSLSATLIGQKRELLKLENSGMLNAIGFEHVGIINGEFEIDRLYYMRVAMPIFPRREIPIYVRAVSKNECKIEIMHEEDRADWDAYVASKEREMIRQLRG